ncbi:Hydroxylysine kinase [Merluccius polli]|uniref:Hydroxylysine kinase n=1 Tax=Merluccius polli TaxID=89951 RepID=A0AA47N1X3_MERPO|nr:Hydroxylysine kinase [Merluccius polli]
MSVQVSKPHLSEVQALEVVRRLYGLEVSTVRPLPSYEDQNFYVAAAPGLGGEYLLKVTNAEDSKDTALVGVQTHTMRYLRERGVPTQDRRAHRGGGAHEPPRDRYTTTTTPSDIMGVTHCGFGCQKYLVRLLTYLPGTTISKVPTSPQLLYEVGKMAAWTDKFLLEMDHPHLSALQRDTFIWNLSNVPLLEGYIHNMDGDPLQGVVKAVLKEFKTSVLPNRPAFRKCINHGDFNNLNILVEPDESSGGNHRISAVLDFGDMSSGYYVYELAISIMHMMMEHPDPVAVGRPIMEGWESVVPLNREERDCLYLLVLCRFCQALVMARHMVKLHPENEEYLMITSQKGIHILRQLWDLGKAAVERVWFQNEQAKAETAGDRQEMGGERGDDTQQGAAGRIRTRAAAARTQPRYMGRQLYPLSYPGAPRQLDS